MGATRPRPHLTHACAPRRHRGSALRHSYHVIRHTTGHLRVRAHHRVPTHTCGMYMRTRVRHTRRLPRSSRRPRALTPRATCVRARGVHAILTVFVRSAGRLHRSTPTVRVVIRTLMNSLIFRTSYRRNWGRLLAEDGGVGRRVGECTRLGDCRTSPDLIRCRHRCRVVHLFPPHGQKSLSQKGRTKLG